MVGVVAGAVGAAGLACSRRRAPDDPPATAPREPRRSTARRRRASAASRRARNAELARLGARVGRTYASTAARKVFASAERAAELDRERELRTAEDIAASLGEMKGALMKLGQMASYLDEGLPEPLRLALSQLQAQAPPMSAELAAAVVEQELGAPPEQLFVEWDPDPDRRGVDRPGPPGALVGPGRAAGAGRRRQGPVPGRRPRPSGPTWPTPTCSARS